MNENFSIGKRIRELRLRSHLSQEQLAFAAEITTAYLGQLERNEKNPTVSVVTKICNALGVELSDFFSQKNILNSEIDPFTLQILNLLKNYDDEVKVMIISIIKQMLKLHNM